MIVEAIEITGLGVSCQETIEIGRVLVGLYAPVRSRDQLEQSQTRYGCDAYGEAILNFYRER